MAIKPSDVSAYQKLMICMKCRAALGDNVALNYLLGHRNPEVEAFAKEVEDMKKHLTATLKLHRIKTLLLKAHDREVDIAYESEMLAKKIERFQAVNSAVSLQDLVKDITVMRDAYIQLGSYLADQDGCLVTPNFRPMIPSEFAERYCALVSSQLDSFIEYAQFVMNPPTKGR